MIKNVICFFLICLASDRSDKIKDVCNHKLLLEMS